MSQLGWFVMREDNWHDKNTIPPLESLLLMQLKAQLVASEAGRSPPLSHAEQRLHHHTPKTSPPPRQLRGEECANLALANESVAARADFPAQLLSWVWLWIHSSTPALLPFP